MYRKWLINLFRIFIALTLLFLGFLFVLNENYFDMTLKKKSYLLQYNPKIYLAGDSRAQRQLIPQKAIVRLGLKDLEVANIAVESGDILALEALIRNNKEAFSNSYVVLSVSSIQINDGAVGLGSYSNAMLSRLSLWEQIVIFCPGNTDVLKSYYQKVFKNWRKKILTPNRKNREVNNKTLGFKGVSGKWDSEKFDIVQHVDRFKWHKNWNPNGKRQQEFEKALEFIKDNVCGLLVYNGPVAPGYVDLVQHTKIMPQEDKFNAILGELCHKYGVQFKSFLYEQKMVDDYFYDPFHLNETGAMVFTEIVMDYIFEDFNKSCENHALKKNLIVNEL